MGYIFLIIYFLLYKCNVDRTGKSILYRKGSFCYSYLYNNKNVRLGKYYYYILLDDYYY